MYGLKKEFESSTVNEQSGFEPLRLYCIYSDISVKFLFVYRAALRMHFHNPVDFKFKFNFEKIKFKNFFKTNLNFIVNMIQVL